MPDGSAQVDLWGDEHTPFESALERYGTWPITVWDIDHSDPHTRKLKALIGDDGSARDGAFTKATDDKSIYRGKVTATIFSPATAARLLNLYAPTSGTVFDPFAGGGTRAIMSALRGLSYVGVELRQAEVDATMARATRAGVASAVQVLQGDARDCRELVAASSADFLLTCPPYWNLEQYDGGPADLSMLPTYEAFLDGLAAVVDETARILKPGAKSCWVVGLLRRDDGQLLPLHHDVAAIHQAYGFRLHEEVVLVQRNNGAIQRVGQFEKGRKFLVRLHEYALVFERGKA